MDNGDLSLDDFESPGDLEIQVRPDDGYRTCPTCGADCSPEPFDAGNGDGLRVAFSCAAHGVHTVIDPFEGSR